MTAQTIAPPLPDWVAHAQEFLLSDEPLPVSSAAVTLAPVPDPEPAAVEFIPPVEPRGAAWAAMRLELAQAMAAAWDGWLRIAVEQRPDATLLTPDWPTFEAACRASDLGAAEECVARYRRKIAALLEAM